MEKAVLRGWLGALGVGAGTALWYLFERMPLDPPDERMHLALVLLAVTFFGPALLITGPLRVAGALGAAALIALASVGLSHWAGLRFASVADYLATPRHMIALALAIVVGLPFIVARSSGRGGWRDYPALFGSAWSLVVRTLAAVLFTLLFWLVLGLSDLVLRLVEVTVLQRLIEADWSRYIVSGGVLGLALAVTHEMRAVLGAFVILRLLRLLVPVICVVNLVFLALVPVRGIEALFDVLGGFSPAGVLLAMAAGAVTLVTSAVDSREEEGVRRPGMVLATRLLALTVPLLVGLAIWALALRIGQYGWSPNRLAAATAAVFLGGYGLIHAVSALRLPLTGTGWGAGVRRGNTLMALGLVAIAALSLTPLLDAERISARSHEMRLLDGRLAAAQLDLAALENDWGRAGQAAALRLRAHAAQPGQEALAARIAAHDRARTRMALPLDTVTGPQDALAALRDILPLAGAPAEAPPGLLEALPAHRAAEIAEGCRPQVPGEAARCVGIVETFWPEAGEEAQLLILWQLPGSDVLQTTVISQARGAASAQVRDGVLEVSGSLRDHPPAEVIAAIRQGRHRMETLGIRAIRLDGLLLVPRP